MKRKKSESKFVNISYSERKHYNRGLGREFSSFYEAEMWGKRRGLECIGGENARKIIEGERKSTEEKQNRELGKIIDEGRREIHHLGSFWTK